MATALDLVSPASDIERDIRGIGLAAKAAAAVLALAVMPVLAPNSPHLTPAIALAVLALGAGGTGLAYLLYYRLIAEVGATTTSMVTYLMPVTAVILGVVVRHEPITRDMVIGAIVVVGAVALAEGRWAARSTVPAVNSP